jgi:hypothetical protein
MLQSGAWLTAWRRSKIPGLIEPRPIVSNRSPFFPFSPCFVVLTGWEDIELFAKIRFSWLKTRSTRHYGGSRVSVQRLSRFFGAVGLAN